jgi:hypothetical protein
VRDAESKKPYNGTIKRDTKLKKKQRILKKSAILVEKKYSIRYTGFKVPAKE